jgi:hypothetical protein
MSPEHALARCGCATSSAFKSILAKGDGKMRRSYRRQVVAEMLTGKPVETYRGAHMERGQDQEPFARMAYIARTGNMVDGVEFIRHPKIAAGCSPDGLIDDDGGLELKSVIATVQIETILAGGYPSEHKAQIQGNLWITGRKWWDFGSFCADMPEEEEHLRLYVFRAHREEDYIAKLEAEVTAFVREAEQMRDLLLGRGLESRLRESLEAAHA